MLNRHLTIALTLLATLLHPAGAPAKAQSPTALTPVALSAEPVSVGTLGLSLHLPEGSSVQTDEIPGGKVKMIVQADDGTWVIQIYNTRSSNLELTAAQALDSIVTNRVLEGPTTTVPGTNVLEAVMQPSDRVGDLRIPTFAGSEGQGVPGARAYVTKRYPRPDIVYPPSGYTILRLAPGSFITIQLDCLEEDFEQAKHVYETVIASARATDPDKQARQRSMFLAMGERFLQDISKSELDALMKQGPTWYRMYEPATTGSPSDAKEVGYQRIEARLGQLGELDRGKEKVNWSKEERAYGYLVSLDARTLETPTVSAEAGKAVTYIDTTALFFLSRNRDEEFWNVSVQFNRNNQRQDVSQNFIRRGSRVTVRTSFPDRPEDVTEYDVLEKNYLSAVERVLLPRIVARRAADDAAAVFNLGFYTYDSTRTTITYRSERFERTPGGGWIQKTAPYQDAVPWASTLDRDGNLISQSIPPVRSVERTEIADLHRLWKSKGLPTGERRIDGVPEQ